MLTDRLLPRKVRQAVFDWARRYSGYDDHLKQEHPFQGWLEWGDVRFAIKTVTFENGRMVVKADAGATEAGNVCGIVTLVGPDGKPVIRGTQDKHMGIKLSATTWSFTWTTTLPVTADDTPPAPQAA